MGIEAVAFDLEGTIVDVEKAHHQGWIESAREVGLTLSLDDCFRRLDHFIGGPDVEVAREISQLAGPPADYRHILTRKKYHYQILLPGLDITPREGFLDFLRAIWSMELKYAIGSMTNTQQGMFLLEKSGLIDYFERSRLVFREDVKNPKPAPDVWQETARRVGVPPETQLVFEDSAGGIMGAVTVGAYCVGMPTYNRSDVKRKLVEAGARRIFLGWDEIDLAQLLYEVNQERRP